LWLVGLWLAGLPALAQTGEPGRERASETTTEHTLQQAGERRQYLLHVPPGLQPGAAPGSGVPLLVAMHGGGGNMRIQADARFYGLTALADREGFIVAFPNGYSRLPGGQLASWNAGRCCAAAMERGSEDVGFIRALVDEVARQWPIDRQRIWATGMSNGGMMAHRLACDAADLFSAIAPVAGTDNTASCQPSKPVSVLVIHARDDERVLFEGGVGPGTQRLARTDSFTGVPQTVQRWVQRNACQGPPQPVRPASLQPTGAQCERYAPCAGGAQVQVCVTDGGGHSWPGGAKPRSRAGGPEPSSALSANEVMWQFFSSLPARP
jgi:polyhydroxybutyrate depolymerase